MELQTARLLLRELRIEDAEAAQRYECDPEVVRYQANGVRTLAESRDYIRRALEDRLQDPRRVYELALCSLASGEYMGRMGLKVKSVEHREGMLWFVIDPSCQKRGYVTEAAGALLDYAFDTLALHRVYVDCDPRNVASIRVAEKLAMRREAYLRENFWNKGEWTDSVFLAILDREWRDRRGPKLLIEVKRASP